MTARVLHLAKDLTLPLDAVTQTLLIVGKRGSGKSNTAWLHQPDLEGVRQRPLTPQFAGLCDVSIAAHGAGGIDPLSGVSIMSTYASAIATLEHDLQDLDARRGRIIAAIGSLRALDGTPVGAPADEQPRAAKRTDGRSKAQANRPAARSLPKVTAPTSAITAVGQSLLATLRAQGAMSPGALAKAHGYKSTTALRHHMAPLLTAGRVVQTGKSAALRFSLPVTTETVAPRLSASAAPRTVDDHEVVWDGSKGSPSLTGSVAGMGSSLSGTQYEVGRRLR